MADVVRDTIAYWISLEVQQSSIPLPPLGYGVDLVCVKDIDPSMRETDSETVESLAQDCFHRLTTPRGSIDDDPNFGFDVRSLLSVGLTQAYIRSIESQASGELQKDDRITFAACTLTQTGSLKAATFTLTVDITPANPAVTPFRLIATVADGQALLSEILL